MTIFINDYTIRIMLMEKKYVDTRSDNVFTIIPLSLQCKNWGVWGSRRREEMRWTWHNDMMKSLVGIMWIVLVLISGTYDQSTIFLTKFYCRPEYSNWSFAKRILQLSSIFFFLKRDINIQYKLFLFKFFYINFYTKITFMR